MMGLGEFINRLKVLNALDRDELVDAGVITDTGDWLAYSMDPVAWLIRATDAQADKLWALIQSRAAK